MTSVEGGCLCGEIAFTVELPTLWCAHCHCTMCQRAHGAPLVTWVGAGADRFTLARDDTLAWFASSEEAERGFCTRCGSTLFFRSKRWQNEMHIVRTAFHGEIDREPAAHVFFDTHVPWLHLADDELRRVDDPLKGK